MENLTNKEIDFEIAREQVRKLKKFYISFAIFAIFIAAYSLRKYYLSGEIVFIDQQNISIIFWVWAIILSIKGAKLYFLNPDWERRMVNKQLKHNNHGNI